MAENLPPWAVLLSLLHYAGAARRIERQGIFKVHQELSDLAERLGRYMAEPCVDGMPRHFGDELLHAFPEESAKTVKLALAELEADGLVELSPVLGPHLPRVRTTAKLFIACDAAITGHNPVEDSVVLARMLIDDPKLGGHARNLETASGWNRRRFNPAFALVLPNVADGRVRKVIQPDYPALGMVLADEDIVQLQRYVQRHAQ